MEPDPTVLTARFLRAVALAQCCHRPARRPGAGIPYMAHLMVVCGLVVEDGGDEDEAIAAVLHDAVEDGGERPLLGEMEREFGSRVAAIVAGCSDSFGDEPPSSWIERKQRYIEHLPAIHDDGTLRVALADKVHNARSLVRAQLRRPRRGGGARSALPPSPARSRRPADRARLPTRTRP